MFSKREVEYESPAKGEDHCGICQHFIAPQACAIVVGIIKPADWCKEFLAMPAESKAQRTAAAIAEHAPGKLYKRNRSMLSMTKDQLHDYASTKSKGLPAKAKGSKKKFSI